MKRTSRSSKEATPDPVSWHTLDQQNVLDQIGSSHEGLTQNEAAKRQKRFGPNEIAGGTRTPWWTLLFEQFKNVLIIVLLVATALSAVLGHALEAIAIAVIVLFAILLSFIQNFRAEKAIDRLRNLAAPNASVMRDGKAMSIPARDLVPGDLVSLNAGDRVPADIRLLSAINLKLDEAPLTGESLPVDKTDTALDAPNAALGDRTNMAYSGTSVTYGRGTGIVTAIGMKTEFGKIATLLDTIDTSPTPLQKNLDLVGKRLAQAAFVIVTVIATLGLLRGQSLLDTIVFAIALAVAVVPEALPAVVTISLAIGVQHLIRKNALIRRLPAVETLGATSVICSDKTGTLTKDQMTVRQVFTQEHRYTVTGTGYEPQGDFLLDGSPTSISTDLEHLLTAGLLASDARLQREGEEGDYGILGDPTEGALVVAAIKAGLKTDQLEEAMPRLAEIPFSSERKRMTTLHRQGDHIIAFSKGAPEVLVPQCGSLRISGESKPMGEQQQHHLLDAAQTMAQDALRVIAIASKTNATEDTAEENMTFLGLVGMIDPPRAQAKEAIRICHEAGIKVVMITGDHPVTAQAIARELELTQGGTLITGPELATMDQEKLEHAVEEIDIYARVSPEQKLHIVTALQKNGHITAMTGDGVNDAPALKKADLGIAMGITGTDVSKEAADMTLTDDNFASIVRAIEEGRGIYANIRKYLAYLLSANIGEIGLIATASAVGLPMPLTAVQILYVNLATDGLPALALAVDPPEPNQMKRRPRAAGEGIFTKPLVALMTVGGLWSTVINLGVFIGALRIGYNQVHAMTLTFVTLVLIQFLKAYNFRSVSESILRRPWANKWLNLAIVWELALLGLVVHVPILHSPFGTQSLTPTEWLVALALSATIIPVLEIAKKLTREPRDGSGN